MARPASPEPKVFCSDEATGGPQWYRDTYFAHAGDERLLGEKSTSYLEDAPRPRAGRGDAGRHPRPRPPPRPHTAGGLELAVQHRQRAGDAPPGDRARENLAGARPWDPSRTSVSPYAYLERGRYTDYLGPWMSAFPATSHVLFLQDLLADGHLSDDLWAALGVAPPRSAGPERP